MGAFFLRRWWLRKTSREKGMVLKREVLQSKELPMENFKGQSS